ncbi:50S ribosomal protein L10 [Croceimicrobium hydrocarbonivorans]|uniref:Large ribosomal subunit protein uL10 n=1 Tax=Croceimicrobium hydrocarbonivorans TaxID=2761580 RepID=A0A7H0VGI2_9FLAO|nr:50S ribosomal protein L10 [Croceimicrobium hydrocarbonivorans]QNR24830.1 50S ribosomal protein L10 [Croceimicrobium hydrocarbonivorans]
MTREEKNKEIEVLLERLENSDVLYITDIEGLNAEQTSNLRRTCYKAGISLNVVKNTLLKKAMERSSKDFEALYPTLKGSTSIMFAEAGNAPARLIKDMRKKKQSKPVIKGAFIQEAVFIGDDQLEVLSSLKSKDELVADIIALLQSPAKNVISGLNGAGGKLAGLLKTLEERAA